MRQEHKRKMRKQMGRRYLAILCIIAIFCTSIPITTTQTQARAYTDWEVFETNTGEPVAAAYGNGVFALLNNAGVFYISDDAMTWTQTGLLPGTNGETNDTYKMLQMKFINNAFYLYGIKGIFLRSVDGKVWERIDFGNRLVTAMTYGDNASAVQLRSQMQMAIFSIGSLTEPMENLPEFMMQMVRKWQEKQQTNAASGKPCRQKPCASCTMEDTV